MEGQYSHLSRPFNCQPQVAITHAVIALTSCSQGIEFAEKYSKEGGCHFLTEEGHLLNSREGACDSSGQQHPCDPCCTCDKQDNSLYRWYFCCRPTYFITKSTQNSDRLLKKDLCKISLWLFYVRWYHMTHKPSCGKTDSTTNATNIYRLKSIWDRCQELF